MDEERMWDVLSAACQEALLSPHSVTRELLIEARMRTTTPLPLHDIREYLRLLDRLGYVRHHPGTPEWTVTQAGFGANQRRLGG